MILTNALLSIAFSMISAYTNAVKVPVDEAPTEVRDLRNFWVGSPFWPVDVCVEGRSGTVFQIQHGIVRYYRSSGSFMYNHDKPGALSGFRGEPVLSSNQVFELADETVRKFVRRRDPLAGMTAHVQRLREFVSKGPEVPFYLISWSRQAQDAGSPASLEIDARKGLIVAMSLDDYSFYNLAVAWDIRNRVFLPSGTNSQSHPGFLNPAERLPPLSTNQTLAAMHSCDTLCRRLGFNPITPTDPGAVDWINTFSYTNPWIVATTTISRVSFIGGGWLDALGGVVCDAFSADSCYIDQWWVRTPEDWYLYEGMVNYSWADLAHTVETNLLRNVGVPKALLEPYSRRLRNTSEPVIGEPGLKRVLVEWTNGAPQAIEYVRGSSIVWENHLGFAAEFDVESGRLTSIRFRDPAIIRAMADAD
jgi:hypothetical protein